MHKNTYKSILIGFDSALPQPHPLEKEFITIDSLSAGAPERQLSDASGGSALIPTSLDGVCMPQGFVFISIPYPYICTTYVCMASVYNHSNVKKHETHDIGHMASGTNIKYSSSYTYHRMVFSCTAHFLAIGIRTGSDARPKYQVYICMYQHTYLTSR